ncbi:MAG TPA: isocitrate/isopropylmalate dehydrogenase family protein [Candidatus Binatus sp.]|nr:isocitrate/isopropylmalate dehydrogenase family protein [Candidatus Binatus sp.]
MSSPKTHKISVLPGDGVGPEVVDATLMVLDAVQEVEKVRLEYVKGDAGFYCIEKYGTNLPPHTVELIKKTEACLKGPMTTPEEPGSPRSVAVTLRSIFDLYANMRPARTLPNVESLKPGIDMVIVRENTEGLYAGKEFEVTPGVGVAMRIITKAASERVTRFALDLAMKRRKRLTFVHKGNILKITDGIFKDAVHAVAKSYPQVELEDMHIDAATMQLIKRPESFDVLVTTNLFGDILSDEAAQLVGGLGVAAGANIGDHFGMFEPVHGSAPKYTGQNRVNPVATIESVRLMMEYLGEKRAADRIKVGVEKVLEEGKTLTYDLGGKAKTSEMGAAIADKVRSTQVKAATLMR